MGNPGGHARKDLRRAKRECLAPICSRAGCATHRSPAAPLERGEVHRLSYGDPPVRLACNQVMQDLVIDIPVAGCMGIGGAQDAGRGYGAHMRAVSLRQQGGGLPGAPGEELPQPGAPGKATLGVQMDN